PSMRLRRGSRSVYPKSSRPGRHFGVDRGSGVQIRLRRWIVLVLPRESAAVEAPGITRRKHKRLRKVIDRPIVFAQAQFNQAATVVDGCRLSNPQKRVAILQG